MIQSHSSNLCTPHSWVRSFYWIQGGGALLLCCAVMIDLESKIEVLESEVKEINTGGMSGSATTCPQRY